MTSGDRTAARRSVLLGAMKKNRRGGDKELDGESATMFWKSAAMLNCMAQDRLDLSFASKVVSRRTTQKYVDKLKRIIRYLSQARRRCIKYEWRSPANQAVAYSDRNWPDAQTHKWRSDVSSADAQLNAIAKSMAELLSLRNMMKECGRDQEEQMFTDSSAVNRIFHQRRGAAR